MREIQQSDGGGFDNLTPTKLRLSEEEEMSNHAIIASIPGLWVVMYLLKEVRGLCLLSGEKKNTAEVSQWISRFPISSGFMSFLQWKAISATLEFRCQVNNQRKYNNSCEVPLKSGSKSSCER